MIEMEYKQVIIIREDLPMSLGKFGVQTAHAAVMGMQQAGGIDRKSWIKDGKVTILLGCKDLSELTQLYYKASGADLPTFLVVDFGYTEFDGPTTTCLAIGPALKDEVDRISKNQKLYKGENIKK